MRAPIPRFRFMAALATLALACAAGCGRSGEAEPATESERRAARLDRRWIPNELGVERAVAISTRPDLSDVQVFRRDDDPDVATRPVSVVTVVTLVAGLRSGLVDASTRHVCNGFDCWRAHGELSAADALASSCNHFFDDLASRLGSSALGATFAALGLQPPSIPEDPAARVRLATRSEGWSLSPRAALPLARAMFAHTPPWFPLLDEAFVPRVSDPGPLRGKAGSDDQSGWFVGYATDGEPRLLAVRVSGCVASCSMSAVRVGRWAIERLRGDPHALETAFDTPVVAPAAATPRPAAGVADGSAPSRGLAPSAARHSVRRARSHPSRSSHRPAAHPTRHHGSGAYRRRR